MAKLETVTRKTKRENASWEQVLEILEELKEKYKLSYCGPATPEVAEKVVEENNGYVLMKYNTCEYYEQDLTRNFGDVKVGRKTSNGDVALYYGLSEDFLFDDYVIFCGEFADALNSLAHTEYWLCEPNMPGDGPDENSYAAIFPDNSEYIIPTKDDENAKKFEVRTNGLRR